MSRFPLAFALIAAMTVPALAASKVPSPRRETKLALASAPEATVMDAVALAPAVTTLPSRTARMVRVVLPSPYGR